MKSNKLFKKLFSESFDTLGKGDIKDGELEGISSPYSGKIDTLGMTLEDLNDNEKDLTNKIAVLHRKLEYGIQMSSSQYLENFKKFSNLLEQSMEINKFFDSDSIIQQKLSDILSYSYSRLNGGNYRVYSDLTTAKDAVRAIFEKAKSFGLNFFDSDEEDLIQKILLSVLYKETKK